MGANMETLTFSSRKQFLEWAQRVVKAKVQRYNRAPKPPQIWIYADGHVAELAHGKRGGTMLSNLAFMGSTAIGKLEHKNDALVVSDIDRRGGVVITINWGDDKG
jgi:hypothetical protein